MFSSGETLAKFFEEVYFKCILACLLRKMGEREERCNQMDIAHFYDALLVLFWVFFFPLSEGLIGLVELPVCL